MVHLPAELWSKVDTHIVSGTTFGEFVAYTKHWTEKQRSGTLKDWIQRQPVDERLGSFEGTSEEIKVVMEYLDGSSSFW
jgi:hypothetical protein